MGEVRYLEKLCHSPAAVALAMRGSLDLVERGFMRWESHAWNGPAFFLTENGVGVGVLCLEEAPDPKIVKICLAHVLPGHPAALLKLLSALRAKYRDRAEFETVEFTFHDGNSSMTKVLAAFAGHLWTHTCRIRLADVAPKRDAS
jgi:hypothetical protein